MAPSQTFPWFTASSKLVHPNNLLASSSILEHDGRITTEEVRHQAAVHGLRLTPAEERASVPERAWWQQPKLLALAIAGVLMLIGLALEKLVAHETGATAFYLATVTVGGYYPARSGLKALRTRRLTISTLLIAAAAGAMALVVFEEAALLIVIFSLGDVLEDYAADRARSSIRALMTLVPALAQRRNRDGTTASASESVTIWIPFRTQ